jgi:hypothetical protein
MELEMLSRAARRAFANGWNAGMAPRFAALVTKLEG